MVLLYAAVALLASIGVANAQVPLPFLVRDIETGATSSGPRQLTGAGGSPRSPVCVTSAQAQPRPVSKMQAFSVAAKL
jgi:hypothetical protein